VLRPSVTNALLNRWQTESEGQAQVEEVSWRRRLQCAELTAVAARNCSKKKKKRDREEKDKAEYEKRLKMMEAEANEGEEVAEVTSAVQWNDACRSGGWLASPARR
jgi:hypothetical protein